MRTVGLLFIAVLAASVASVTEAGPLMPVLSPTPVAGEAALIDTVPPIDPAITALVDWMVLGPSDGGAAFTSLIEGVFGVGTTVVPAGNWLYAYQVEALTDGTEIFTVTVPDITSIVSFGSLSGMDLDAVGFGHSAAVFPNLGGAPAETEGFTCCESVIGVSVGLSDVSWTFFPPVPGVPGTGLRAGEESEVLFFVATRPPVYNFATVLDSTTAGFPAAGLVPSPAPEPGSALLLLLGVGSLVAYRRRRS